ncbi:hypothetical protein [Sagittula salina]|uniref:Uncharacterized protein n=1 Tax=Sagittula salina TaxID=2820268 RepID=A0A940S2Y2_9RHOB|nr:hypothetical protein [Sagittula salina]MBP0482449.1 hypothetical protein [Sagittula salina]
MPWAEAPAFHATLKEQTFTHLALRLPILTGVPSGPLPHWRLAQIDGEVWPVPSAAMKGHKRDN